MENDNKSVGWLVLVLMVLAQFMLVLDVSIVNVMLPTVQTVFHLRPSSLQWIITTYTVSLGGLLLLGGRTADLYGRKKVFLCGLLAFTFFSLLDGLSKSGNMLITLRAFQGAAAAFTSPAALSIVLVTYQDVRRRNIALSVWGSIAAGGTAIGVLLGGIITQNFGWRWNFFINVPIGITVAIISFFVLSAHQAEEGEHRLDLPGAFLITSGLMALVYGITKTPTSGWTGHITLTYFAISALLLVGFVINELKAPSPLVDFSIFKLRNVIGANLSQFAIGASLYSVFFFTTLYLQEILHYSPTRTGLSFIAIPVAIAITAIRAPDVIKAVGYKPLMIIGPILGALGLVVMAHVPVEGSYFTHILPGFVIMGLGLGFIFVGALEAATTNVPTHLSGLASGLINTSQQVGGSLGVAVLTGILVSSTSRYLHGLHVPPTPSLEALATVHGYHVGYYMAICFPIASAVICSVIIKQYRIGHIDMETEIIRAEEHSEEAIEEALHQLREYPNPKASSSNVAAAFLASPPMNANRNTKDPSDKNNPNQKY